MAKWYGQVGFAVTEETSLDVWTEMIKEYPYYGDILFNNRSLERDNEVNNEVSISNKISFVADPYARENFHEIKYATFMGTKWRVNSVEVQYPRLIMTLGGVWHEKQNGSIPSI